MASKDSVLQPGYNPDHEFSLTFGVGGVLSQRARLPSASCITYFWDSSVRRDHQMSLKHDINVFRSSDYIRSECEVGYKIRPSHPTECDRLQLLPELHILLPGRKSAGRTEGTISIGRFM